MLFIVNVKIYDIIKSNDMRGVFMKKYRCPYCGEECITLSNKIFSYEVKNPRARYVNYDGNRCPSCGGVFAYNQIQK